jgi:hypothetical protein
MKFNRLFNLLAAWILLLLLHPVPGCGDPVADDFFAFVARADRSPPPVTGLTGGGQLVDITGSYLFNISLRVIGEVFLELRVQFDTWALEPGGERALTSGGFYFPEDPMGSEPIARFEGTVIDSEGRMVLDLGFVRLEPDRSPIRDTAVETSFKLSAVVVDRDTICGLIDDDESEVLQPIQIRLRGVTFSALRYGEDGVQPQDVPTSCPPGFVAEPGGGGGGIVRPPPPEDPTEPLPRPDIPLGPGVVADISGRYWLRVNINNALPLDLLAYMEFEIDEEDGPVVWGAFFLPNYSLARGPAGTFRATVDENGEFLASVRGLQVITPLVTVLGDVAMLASIRSEDFWCGGAGGTIFEPPIGDLLETTTFGAIRFDDESLQPPFASGYRPEGTELRCPAVP